MTTAFAAEVRQNTSENSLRTVGKKTQHEGYGQGNSIRSVDFFKNCYNFSRRHTNHGLRSHNHHQNTQHP